MRRIVGLVPMATLLAGCYSYTPLVTRSPEAGERVRVRLSAPEAARLSERTGTLLRQLEGTVVDVPQDSLRISVWWGEVYAGTRFEGRRDTLSFANTDLLEVDEKRFSPQRTALVAGGTAALAGVAVGTLVGRSGGGREGENGPQLYVGVTVRR